MKPKHLFDYRVRMRSQQVNEFNKQFIQVLCLFHLYAIKFQTFIPYQSFEFLSLYVLKEIVSFFLC